MARTGGEYILAIAKRSKESVIGTIGMCKKPDRFSRWDYRVGEKFLEQGFEAQALQCAVANEFDRLKAEFLTAVTLELNRTFCRVLEKSNFVQVVRRDMLHRESDVRWFVHIQLNREMWKRAHVPFGKGETR